MYKCVYFTLVNEKQGQTANLFNSFASSLIVLFTFLLQLYLIITFVLGCMLWSSLHNCSSSILGIFYQCTRWGGGKVAEQQKAFVLDDVFLDRWVSGK